MPLRDDEHALDPIDELLAQDRKLMAGAASERIAGGMYARIARAHAERSLVVARGWQRQLLIAAVACAVLAVWFALPRKNGLPVVHPRAQLPVTPPSPAPVAARPLMKTAPVRAHVHFSSRSQVATVREEVPQQVTFPSNVAPTEQEVLLMQLASHQPQELLAVAKAIADMRDREDKERHDFDQWVQRKGEAQ